MEIFIIIIFIFSLVISFLFIIRVSTVFYKKLFNTFISSRYFRFQVQEERADYMAPCSCSSWLHISANLSHHFTMSQLRHYDYSTTESTHCVKELSAYDVRGQCTGCHTRVLMSITKCSRQNCRQNRNTWLQYMKPKYFIRVTVTCIIFYKIIKGKV